LPKIGGTRRVRAKVEMRKKDDSRDAGGFDRRETLFRLIDPEDYPGLGIDPQDVPMGTFASEDHPGFLPSRFGGNAYGLGLIEQSVLSRADTDFLERVDFQKAEEVGGHARELNAIYQKLGLLIRFSLTGKLYFLIPINLVAHSLQEIKTKADEVEELAIQHIFDTRSERLDIGLLTTRHDLIVHELTARLSRHRIFLLESVEKLRAWRTPLDMAIMPKDPFEYLLEQQFPQTPRRSLNRRRLIDYAAYLAGKIYDILEPNGKILVMVHSPGPQEDRVCRVRFKSLDDLKLFLLFSHTFKTRQVYTGHSTEEAIEIHLADLHYYLNRFAPVEPHLRRLLDRRKPEDLSIGEINDLPHLNLRLPHVHLKDPERQWKWIFDPFYRTKTLGLKTPRQPSRYWQERLEIDRELPEQIFAFVGQPRQPTVTLNSLDEEVRASGMHGCSLPLVPEHRNSFRFLLDVLKILARIRRHDFPKLSELELARLNNAFRSNTEKFNALSQLIGQIERLEKIRDVLNPDGIEGDATLVLENIPKFSLLGFTGVQLREILLIVVGHTTMSRVVFGKISSRSLKPITDKAREGNTEETLDLLRLCRLMSLAEIAAALGDAFTAEQARELSRLYDDACTVATDPSLDWDRLHDLRISALGGVQNKALREMMKLFNLFEFLDDWQSLLRSGRLQREVICDYEPGKLGRMDETLALVEIAGQFKERCKGDCLFGRSYFFRQFLNADFHGTGRLFPRLGARAGFILLWIGVNATDRRMINFNPMLSGIPADRREARIAKIRETILRIPLDELQPQFFARVGRTFAEGKPAFIFDSGIRLTNNTATRSVDVSFVDVEENIRRMRDLFPHFESRKLEAVPVKSLQEMERWFSEVVSFHRYLQEGGCCLECGIFDRSGGLEAKEREIEEIEQRLKNIILNQILVPEETYDTLVVLARRCPEMLSFVLPEFRMLGNLVKTWPKRETDSLGAYVLRCLEKFQALVIRDRNSFQDRNVYYQLAKQEFGPLAEEGIGPTHAQMDILEYMVERIHQDPLLYRAFTFSLLFQDIGKIEQYAATLLEPGPRPTHAEQGALILERSDILKNYNLGDRVEKLVVLLVSRHDSIGRVIRGEEPFVALEGITEARDERLLDVFVLHSILAVSAFREGLMVSDLLDAFLTFRAAGLNVIGSGSDWRTQTKQILREKGGFVPDDPDGVPRKIIRLSPDDASACGFFDADMKDIALWDGRRMAALERLLKLMGVLWVDYNDLQMHFVKMPVHFIYHKKRLKSVGPSSFEKELKTAIEVHDVVSSLSPEVRFYLLYCLDHLGGAMRIYDFHPLSEHLEPGECVKLLVLSLQAFHHHFGVGARRGFISFRNLCQAIEGRREALQNILRSIPFPATCFQRGADSFTPKSCAGLVFQPGDNEPAIRVDYQDAFRFDLMAGSLAAIWDHGELNSHYSELSKQLHANAPDDAGRFEEDLQKIYEEQRKRINDRILKAFEGGLSGAGNFTELEENLKDLMENQEGQFFSEEQQFVLKEIYEFHRSRLRDIYLDSIYRELNLLTGEEDLCDYWKRVKGELFPLRPYVGKEYESLIAQFIDSKIARIREGTAPAD